MSVAPDRRAAIVGFYQILSQVNVGPRRLRLRGIDPSATYKVSVWPESVAPIPAGLRLGGDALMAGGLVIEAMRMSVGLGDFHARLYVLEAE